MRSRSVLVAVVTVVLGVLGTAPGSGRVVFSPGSPGVGDRYFPKDGNGGYDVAHYDLDLTYRPGSNRLAGVATIRAFATKNLSRFDLDLDGLHVLSIQVDGRRAAWTRNRGELKVTPRTGLREGRLFTTQVSYTGRPRPLADGSGFIHTGDGALAVGEPHGASHWFPVNDHPSDKASYSYRITAPRALKVVANGELRGQSTVDGWTTWDWEATEPMASYLATIGIGRWRFHEHDGNGIPLLDAVDPALYHPYAEPRTGEGFAFSQLADSSYKRLTRTISVPASGATLSFRVQRQTEQPWDFFFVEAHTVGQDDWTTLPDERGHTRRSTGYPCPGWLEPFPFLEHYQTPAGDGCSPRGTTGRWFARSGYSNGYERWTVDLTPYAGHDVEVSLSYVSDELFQEPGVFVDDIVSSTGEGSTGFEPDGDVTDGWTVPGAPAGSPGNTNDWSFGGIDDVGSVGTAVDDAFAREGEYLDFLASYLGPYPFSTSGGIVDDVAGLGFALENQTRPTYDPVFFGEPAEGASVVVHELAHQWVGDDLAVQRWRHIWLNEGFARYMEWLWSEHEGSAGPAEIFHDLYSELGRRDSFWDLTIGDPGRQQLFAGQVYVRGAMTLQALRETIGDTAFFTVLHRWTAEHAGKNVTIPQFVRLSERVSGQQLDDLFDAWLFRGTKPPDPQPRAASGRGAPPSTSFLSHLKSRQAG
jgi:hypothetical protein